MPEVHSRQSPGCERRGRARVRPWPLPRTLLAGRSAERPSPESSPLAVSGGRAEAQRSRPERPALPKSAVGSARDCGPPGSDAPFEPQLTGRCSGGRSTAGVGCGLVQVPSPQDRHPSGHSCVNTALHPQKQAGRPRQRGPVTAKVCKMAIGPEGQIDQPLARCCGHTVLRPSVVSLDPSPPGALGKEDRKA
jgi:hypothetical protein